MLAHEDGSVNDVDPLGLIVKGSCTHFLEMSAFSLDCRRKTYRSDILETRW